MDDICESKKPGKEGQECSKKRCGDDNVASTANLATLEDRILTVWMCSVDLDGHLDAKRRSLLLVYCERKALRQLRWPVGHN